MEMEHIIYKESGEEFISFLNSNYYDTPTPYQFCISQFKKIDKEINRGFSFIIISNNVKYIISNSLEFENWIKTIFLGGFEEFVFSK